ncbi:hypothetical protein LXL04_004342 [Taraxacum kok-saghyz]
MDTKLIRSRTRVSVLTKIEGLKMAASLLRFRTSFTLPFSLLPNSIAINSTISRLAFSTASASPRKRVGTHNGTFHCDEALGCFMVSLTSKFNGAQFIRTRNLEHLYQLLLRFELPASGGCSRLLPLRPLKLKDPYNKFSISAVDLVILICDLLKLLCMIWSTPAGSRHYFGFFAMLYCIISLRKLLTRLKKIGAPVGLNKGRNLYEMKTGEMKGPRKVKVQMNWHGLRV